jgi:XTP/dITP diphosphohydrolase
LTPPLPPVPSNLDSQEALGAALFAAVADARDRGLDAEAALRATVLAYADAVRAAEADTG